MVRASRRPPLLGRFRSGGLLARMGALAGMVAIVLQGAVTVAHGAQMGTLAPPAWVAFCGVDRNAPSPSKTEHGLPMCPLCQATHQIDAWLPPTSGWISASPRRVAIVAPMRVDFPIGRLALLGTQARAPPAPV